MPPADHPSSSGPLTTHEQVGMLTDGEGKVSPSTFPVPTASPDYIEGLAEDLRAAGGSVADRGNDIDSSWGGLTSCYKAPEADELYTVLAPVASDGNLVLEGMDQAATALETFAGSLRSIKSRWSTLRTEAYEFRTRIDAEGEDWRKAEGVAGFFGIGESPDVEKNQELIDRGAALVEEYEEAECDCANALNKYVPGRTRFAAMPEGGGDLDPNVFYHGYEQDLSELATEWGMDGATTDEHWWVDVGAAVWDFGVGAVEGTGAMLGAHSSEGWFQMSWGDALLEYHEDNIQSALGLVGMYDAESDSYGWAGLGTVGSAWKDLAHSVVPWEEWGERSGYVIGTALLNIGATVGGAVLTATGVGAVVGVPLMAWRGMAILDGMGGRGGGGSGGSGATPDLNTGLTVDIPRFGGQGAPVVDLDAARFADGGSGPGRLADANAALSRLIGAADSSSSGNGSPDAPRARPASDTSDERPTTGSRNNRSEGTDPYAEDLLTVEDVLNPVSPEATRLRGEYQGDFLEADSRGDGSSSEWETDAGSGRDSSTGPEPDREPALVGGRPDTLTEQASSPSDRVQRADLNDSTGRSSDADRAGERDSRAGQDAQNGRDGGAERPRDGNSGNRGPDLRDDRPGATNRTDTTPSRDGSDSKDRGTSRDDAADRRTKEEGSPRSDRGEGERSVSDRHGRDGDRPGQDGRRHPGLGADDPDSPNTRRDGGDADSDTRPRSDADAGRDGDGDGTRPSSEKNDQAGRNENPVLVPEKRWDAQKIAREILKDMDLGKGTDFRDKFVDLVNSKKYGGLLEKAFYNSLGHRYRGDIAINGEPLPSLVRADPNSPWMPRESLPTIPPTYFFGEIKGSRSGLASKILQKLDKFANLRQISLDAYNPLDKTVQKIKKENNKSPSPALEKKLELMRETRKPMGRMKTRLTELFGERSAEQAVRDSFTGAEVSFEEPVRNANGEILKNAQGKTVTTTWRGTLPELAESTPDKPNPIPPSENAPKNGNDQFDQIWRTKDGGFVIVEAKSSLDTGLNERIVESGGELKLAQQGTREYFEDILREMIKRGGEEKELAEEIQDSMIENIGKIHYIEARGNPGKSGDYRGNSMKFFDIKKKQK